LTMGKICPRGGRPNTRRHRSGAVVSGQGSANGSHGSHWRILRRRAPPPQMARGGRKPAARSLRCDHPQPKPRSYQPPRGCWAAHR
jgi:hypothetical protein